MAKRVSIQTIEKIKELRSKGWSIRELQKKLKVGGGTVWKHIKNIKIKPEFADIYLSKRKPSIYRKEQAEKRAFTKAAKSINSLNEKEKLLILTCLYWGEGGKGDFNLTNTDPEMVCIFIKGLREVFGIPIDRIRTSLRLYEDMDKYTCIEYWSKAIGLPKENFTSVNVLYGKKQGKLKYGMCRVRVLKGGDVLKYIKALRLKLAEYF